MTYNVFGGTLNLALSINSVSRHNVRYYIWQYRTARLHIRQFSLRFKSHFTRRMDGYDNVMSSIYHLRMFSCL